MSPRRLQMSVALGPQPPTEGWATRTPDPADREALAALMLAAYAGTIDADGSETIANARAEIERTFAGAYGKYLAPASFLAEGGGRAAGAGLVTLWEGVPLLAFVMVAPEHQGRGLGALLIRRSMAELHACGYAELRLTVTDGNAPAQRLYARLGFVELPA